MIEWHRIDAHTPKQTMLLVGHEGFRGWFEVAEYMHTVGWVYRGTQTRLDREPTHFAYLNPPQRGAAIPSAVPALVTFDPRECGFSLVEDRCVDCGSTGQCALGCPSRL